MPAGRPTKYKSGEEMQPLIDAYFDSCYGVDEQGNRVVITPVTITGLALAIGTDRRGLIDWSERPEFSHVLKKARAKVEQFVESSLFTGRNPAGAIFWMKNHGWSDTQKLELTGADGGPVDVRIAGMTDAELEQLLED